ncbi:MAG: GNAT family N-acetyltransferase [Candidatus Promineifilaceae bacterium]|nr:GNAT family N-acetyltransferase [Candidatus Promineifilaceae bacterium]
MTEETLRDQSPAALKTAIHSNLFTALQAWQYVNTADYYEDEFLTRWLGGVPHPWFNGVLSGPLPADQAEEIVSETLTYFRRNKIPSFTWWPTVGTEPAELAPHLEAQGLALNEGPPAMAADLASLTKTVRVPPGLRISQAQNEEALDDFTMVMMTAFAIPAAWQRPLLALMSAVDEANIMRHYLAYLDGKAVGSASLLLANGVAGIYNVATRPELRRRGIGAAITLAPLQVARRLGYEVGVLQSSDMAIGVYEKLGFRHYGHIAHFYWPAKPGS